MGEAPAIVFDDVHLRLPDGRELLRGISFCVQAGTTTALLGRSGSGKTTLLRTVNRLNPPTAGRVLLGANDVAAGDLLALRRGIGYVIQESGLFPHWNVARNVAAGLELRGTSPVERAKRVGAMLELAGLNGNAGGSADGSLNGSLAARMPHQLSGGQRQRVGLARALATDPQVLLMDEPFGALDPLTRATMQRATKELLQRLGKTTLIVTHDLREALYLADRIVLLEDGRVAADLPACDVLHSGNAAMQDYVRATEPDGAEPMGERA